MDKTNLELFKQALNEAVSNKFDNIAANCTEEIACSEKHNLAMRAIVYGKGDTKRIWSPRMKRIIAILVAAALLLTSCGIIFRNEIREVFEEFFVKLTYSSDSNSTNRIEEVYVLTYLPEGYYIEKENVSYTATKYKFVNSNDHYIYFEQSILKGSNFNIDSETGYSKIIEIEERDVYYRYTKEFHSYIWSDDKYVFVLKTNANLQNEEIELIINGIK